jgi:hypothetical protein
MNRIKCCEYGHIEAGLLNKSSSLAGALGATIYMTVDAMSLVSYHTQHNDTQYNDTQYNDTQYNDTQHNELQHNVTQNNETQNNDQQRYYKCHLCRASCFK